MTEKITTLNPQEGKQGKRIDKAKYELFKAAILSAIRRKGQISLDDLRDTLEDELAATFDGNVSWHVITIKLDLEARKIIERVPGETPQQLRLAK